MRGSLPMYFEDDVENNEENLVEVHDDGKVYLFDSNDLYTGPFQTLGSRRGLRIGEKTPILEEGFIKKGVRHGKWIDRNHGGEDQIIKEYINGKLVNK